MSGKWEPGDVAMVTAEFVSGVRQSEGAVKVADGWQSLVSGAHVRHGDVLDARPLLVIDPEDMEQVARLRDAMWPGAINLLTNWQSALRSLLAPPKPDEPTGLGAVVEDSDGKRFTRVGLDNIAPWYAEGPSEATRPYRYYDGIAAVRVLSEGVTP